ncbi:hypothetical protein QQ045_007994 [Rhodiola kirilowii]
MLRDFKSARRNSTKAPEEAENVPVSAKDSVLGIVVTDETRAPLVVIQEPQSSTTPVRDRSKSDRTPKGKCGENGMKTPEKFGGFSSRNRFGWGQKSEAGTGVESGNLLNVTPRSMRSLGRTSSGVEGNVVHLTPTKSVNKPPTVRKVDGNGRVGMFPGLYRGLTAAPFQPSGVNSVEVPHFDLKEDPSFWMDHNVQVLIRIRPLNEMEKRIQGYSRCLKQESAQTITWIGPPETRFTFDHVACETVDQETLFRTAGLPMVENCLSGYNSCMFAYGQTGSGKTYTMLGEIDQLEINPSPHRGMTPRVFEFLFARIRAEEETRKEEKLKYSCKCSFLEIYNEQITDLLDPSATNLHLREDMKKGVYVENLAEFEVQTVSDILLLLSQGASNRKVAATNMNRESSRSHSVFTCVIESQWEKDATTNLRFARLNLVDLAGSERQKASGAEGDRLKEAASINKSLSTLGHVIMVLLEVAHGKPKHVPYRDSKLTFLLQDSLGGNSKTMIIANVSSATCCATETLNTLKFAQRAKLIQNNAVVNEDSSGDVGALQQQIRILKEELVALKRHNVSRSLSFGKDTAEDSMSSKYSCKEDDMQKATDLMVETESKGTLTMSCKQLKSMETTLAGSLRREQMAESSIKQLEAEIEHLNRLVRQREEDARSTKMMLKFRDDKISRMESLVNNVIPVDSYLFQENKALYEEIQLLTAKLDRNPEVTRFALENIRLLDQIRRFQDFYKEGEKEMLLSEISELRKQLIQRLDGDTMQPCSPHVKTITKKFKISLHGNLNVEILYFIQLKHTSSELEECKSNLRSCLEENAKLSRCETEMFLLKMISSKSPTENYNDSKSSINKTEDLLNVQLELDVFKVILQEEILCRRETEEKAMNFMNNLELARENLSLITMQYTDTKCALQNSKSVVEALESQQIFLINEIDDLKTSNDSVLELLHKKEAEILDLKEQVSGHEHSRALSLSRNYENEELPLQTKLTKMQDSLEKAKSLNTWYQKDLVNQTTSSEEMEKIRRQAEVETAEVIVCLQEELSVLQQHIEERNLLEMEQQKKFKLLEDESKELQQKLLVVTQERNMLDEQLKQKDGEKKTLWDEWKLLTSAIEEVLYEGNESLVDASSDVVQISNSLPGKRSWISEQIGQMAKIKSEKENLVEELRRSLEDANFQISNLDCMLRSLKGAALAINDSHQKELGKKEKEVDRLTSQLSEKSNSMEKMNNDIQLSKGYIKKLYACATAGFVIVNNLSQTKSDLLEDIKQKDAIINELEQSSKTNCELAANQAVAIVEANKKICFLQEELNNVKDKCKELDNVLEDEKAQACFMMKKLQELEANEMLKTKDKLAELQAGVSSVMSSFGMRYSTDSSSTNGREGTDTTNCLLAEGVGTDTSMCSSNIPQSTEIKVLESVSTPHEASRKGYTMSLLRKEIQSALESLEAINVEMEKLRHEKEKAVISESKSQKSMECLKDQVIALETAMSFFEERTGFKMALVQDKLQNVEILVEDTNTCWSKTKELFETEASSMSNRFDESQGALREADIMINKLMIANEAMNGEMEALNKERMVLVHEIQSLKSTNDMLSQQLELLEKQFEKHLADAKGAILELEDNVTQVQDQIQDDFQSLLCDFSGLKNHLMHAKNLMHSSFEDIWSELIVKDCVVSVLHLCHSGLLLETVMRKNVENCLLQHGSSKQHSVIADLKKHNNLSRRGIDMCRAVEGKMLMDIRKSFDRVLKKEEETEQLDLKLITFERTILDLQAQEELMLQRSDAMGCELAKLMKELDKSNSSAMTALLEHDTLLKDKQECINYQNEVFLVEMLSNDVETLVWASKLKELALDAADSEFEKIRCLAISENMKEELVLNGVDGHLKGLLIEDLLNELSIQTRAGKILENERNNLSSVLIENKLSHRKMSEEMELRRLKDVSHSNDVFKKEMDEAIELKWSLLSEIHALKSEHDTFSRELKENDAALELSSIIISYLCQKNQKLEEKVDLLKVTSCEIQSQLEMTESTIGGLQSNMSIKEAELDELHQYQSALLKELSQKSEDHLLLTDRNRTLLEDFHLLKSELDSWKKCNREILSKLSLVNRKSSEKMENVVDMSSIINSNLNQGIVSVAEKLLEEMNCSVEMASQFMKELVCVEDYASSLLFTNESLHTELLRKDEIVKVLLSDLSLLQESTSNTENYKDDLDKMLDSLKDFQEELAKKTADNDELMSKCKTQEAQLQDKNAVISTLQMHIEEANEKLQMLSHEKAELIVQLEDGIAQKCSIEEELVEKKAIIDGLESELLRMNSTLNEACSTIESMQENLDVVISERDHLHSKVLLLEEKLDMAEAQVQETEAIATEAKQMAESEKFYLAEKEEEIKLLERSIEELESTIDVLEDKVEMVKGEAERQRLQREELEIELHALKNQMLSVESCNTDIRRHLNEKEMGLEETLQRVKILEIDLDNKDTEIARLKTHISELNVHAEAQAYEYKQKFKALESMAEKVRLEGSSGPGTGSSSNKLERNSSKPRGSGSPFKCIGLGLVQQMKSEKDEDLTDARRRIAELESLAASRQKEIFMLNSRLAAAESMTHDVIRELLGVKLDMTQYASLLDADQVHKITEKALLHNEEPQMKDTEVAKLKQQLNGLIEERKGWLDEIDRKQAELLTAQVSLEKLHQTNRLLKAENNTFKMENASHKKQVTDLENQVNKLSGQQNLQQRIHHHAKVKEENNFLRTQNEELSLKLQRAENILSRVKEELAAYRASVGKSRYINFDDQERLQDKLKETEEEKLQLAQNLLALCTNILKVAGITSPVSDITILEAEEALGHLKNKITSLERDIEDLKLKNKITLEKARLSELMPQLSPLSPMSEDKSQTPGRLCNAPFLSTLDR